MKNIKIKLSITFIICITIFFYAGSIAKASYDPEIQILLTRVIDSWKPENTRINRF